MVTKNEWNNLYTLLKLAEMGAHKRISKISTEYLSAKLGISQQTASRYLIELEHLGWIGRSATPDGCLIKINDKGLKELENLYTTLHVFLETTVPPTITLEGVVFTGLGEGAYYISKEINTEHYQYFLSIDCHPQVLFQLFPAHQH